LSRAAILVIGNEILDGIVLDTNSQWIIQQLKSLNFDVKETMTVRDETVEISRAINRLNEDGCTMVFTTGGLGPTHDDLTLKGVAEAFEIPLELSEPALAIVRRQYKTLHEQEIVDSEEITDSRKKMAILPKGSTPLDNQVGGAPGVLVIQKDLRIFCLPGVPKELKWIFENEVKSLIGTEADGVFTEKIIVLPLRDESMLAPIIDEVMEGCGDVYIKSLVKPYGVKGIRLWLSVRGDNMKELKDRLDEAERYLLELTEKRLS
jgi:molybdenum cofactor synthesis domain-containing protein